MAVISAINRYTIYSPLSNSTKQLYYYNKRQF